MCNFIEAWIGECRKEGDPFCEKHAGRVCASCGEVATRNCSETMGAMICGADLCRNCEHELNQFGTNGMISKHCRKDAQPHREAYLRNLAANY